MMNLDLRYTLRIPNEILDLILVELDFENRKSSRFVCREFNDSLRLLLFRSLSVSLYSKHLDRLEYLLKDAQLSNAVEEIVWNEIPFEGRLPNEGTSPLVRALCNIRTTEEQPGPDHPSQDQINLLADRLKIGYEHGFQAETSCADVFISEIMKVAHLLLAQVLQSFGRLRRFITRDCLDGGILRDTPFDNEVQGLAEDQYPVSDGICRLLVHYRPETRTPALGLSAILMAMAEKPGSRIDTMVTERTTGLMKTGVPISFFHDTSQEFHFNHPAAFSKLRRISLAICDIPNESTQCTVAAKESGLYRNLAVAEELESLHLSSTYGLHLTGPFQYEFVYRASLRILGVSNQRSAKIWPNLSLLILESFAFNETDMYQFLHRHAKSLRSLTLWNCAIDNGTWPRLLHSMSQDPDLQLEALTIKAPDYIYEGNPGDAHQSKPPEMISGAQIPDEILLAYVNNKQDTNKRNPFSFEPVGSGNDYTYSDAEDLQGFGLFDWDLAVEGDPVFDNNTESDHDSDGPEYVSDSDQWSERYRYERDEDSDIEVADADETSGDDSVVRTGMRQIHESVSLIDLNGEDD